MLSNRHLPSKACAHGMSDETAPLRQDTTEINVIFIHSALDEFGLTAAEFRIYAHIARRATNSRAWPGIDSMARICFLSKPTVIAAVRRLEEMGMLEVRRVEGRKNFYTLTRPSRWHGARLKIDNGGPTGKEETTEQSIVDNGASKKEVTKVHPREVHPKKGIQGTLFVIPSDSLPPPIDTPEIKDAWDIWQEHLRQKKKRLSEEAARMQVAKLKALGPERALAALKHSTESNYTGLYEPRENKNGHRPHRTATDWKTLTKDTAV